MKKDDPLSAESVIAGLMALAVSRTDRRKRRRTLAEIEIWKRSWHRNRRRRAMVACDKALARQRAVNRRPGRGMPVPFGTGLVERVAAAMVPGFWYGGKDLMRLIGAPRGSGAKVKQVMLPAGLVRREENPDYAGPVAPHLACQGFAVPKYVYQLTPLGEALRDAVRMLQ